ncbi:MAG TPA: hypothetical protein PKL65_03890, partial [Bacteroidales bacterium]|nr:hypothetical protein [Bacteroidales bacterium]
TVYWTLNAVLMDKPGRPGENRDVTIFDNTGKIAVQGKTNNQGKFSAELPEYQANGKDRIFFTPYTIVSGSSSITTDLNRNTDVILTY